MKEWINKIQTEFESATKKFGKFNSTHEGYAVLKEEVDELWDAIKGNVSKNFLEEEAIQVAAMALRFLVDCCGVQHSVEGRRAKPCRFKDDACRLGPDYPCDACAVYSPAT